jgi:hypothetical protein
MRAIIVSKKCGTHPTHRIAAQKASRPNTHRSKNVEAAITLILIQLHNMQIAGCLSHIEYMLTTWHSETAEVKSLDEFMGFMNTMC